VNLSVVELQCRHRKFLGVNPSQSLSDATSGNRVCRGIVCVLERNSVVLGGILETTLALTVAVNLFINYEGVNNGSHIAQRLEPVALCLSVKNREIVTGVVGNDWNTGV
jgi:hypothetical protein